MKAIIVASTGAALLALLSGCAGSPVARAEKPRRNFPTRATKTFAGQRSPGTLRRPSKTRSRDRRVDCRPYAAEAARREAQAGAALNAYANSLQRNQVPITRPTQTQCYQLGGQLNCTTY